MQIDRQRVLHLMTTYEVCAVTLENVRPIRAEPASVMPVKGQVNESPR